MDDLGYPTISTPAEPIRAESIGPLGDYGDDFTLGTEGPSNIGHGAGAAGTGVIGGPRASGPGVGGRGVGGGFDAAAGPGRRRGSGVGPGPGGASGAGVGLAGGGAAQAREAGSATAGTSSTGSAGGGSTPASIDYLRDIAALRLLCERSSSAEPSSWEAVRSWLNSHSADEARRGAENVGEFNTTPLHLACRNCPPPDVVDHLLSASPDSVRWEDSFGWLPLHYACANGAAEDVLRMLAEAYPDGKTATDRRGRTPLHFALGNTDRPATPSTVVLLSSTGAGRCADENGMLPLHYACAYGASEEALKILTEGNVDSITACDRKGRTPLHFALGNADRPFSPAVVRLLISQYRGAVDAVDRDGSLPLHLLANRAHTLKEAQTKQRTNAEKCLLLYIEAEPNPTADFLTALQALPGWLGDAAVVHPVVQNLLNDKISQRIPTCMLLLDMYSILMVVITYYILARESVNKRYRCESVNDQCSPAERAVTSWVVYLLYIGGGWLILRECLQVYSLVSLGLLKTWFQDFGNVIDVAFFVLAIAGGALIHTGTGNDMAFRTLAAVTIFLMWVKFLSFLKSMSINFAVFLKGMTYVIGKLIDFMLAVLVILIMFSQAFWTLFLTEEFCTCDPEYDANGLPTSECGERLDIQDWDSRPFCNENFGHSLIKVYTMFLGEVDDTLFSDPFQIVCFAAFMFLAVILLAQVLIAIVTDSYGVISDKATIVFWSNRLDFVAEMDAIVALFACCNKTEEEDGDGDGDGGGNRRSDRRDYSSDLWKKLMDLFEDDISELSMLSDEFWCYCIIRLFVACFVIPVWLIAGVVTAGLLWPPQVRAAIFVFSKRDPSDRSETEQRIEEVNALKAVLKEHQDDLNTKLSGIRGELLAMRAQVAENKMDVASQMADIRQIMTELYDLQQTLDA